MERAGNLLLRVIAISMYYISYGPVGQGYLTQGWKKKGSLLLGVVDLSDYFILWGPVGHIYLNINDIVEGLVALSSQNVFP